MYLDYKKDKQCLIATWEHIVPLSRGGERDGTNCILACKQCNQAKKDRTPEEWKWFMYYDEWREKLQAGETITRTVHGSSMRGRLEDGQKVTIEPTKAFNDIKEGDIVFCKVGSHYYVHLVKSCTVVVKKRKNGEVKKTIRQFLITNNHGHENGWTSKIFGKVIKVED